MFFLPIISIHLLLFASFTIGREQWFIFKNKTAPTTVPSKVNWWFVRYSIMIMFVPKIIGVIGLLILPVEIMNIVIFALIGAYALTYIANKPMRSNSRIMDIIFLAIGAYISGISLLGGPLIIAVALRYIKPYEYRSTLFVLWFFSGSHKNDSLCGCRRRSSAVECPTAITLCRSGSLLRPQSSSIFTG